MFDHARCSARTFLEAGVVAMLCAVVGGTAAAKGKPQAIEPVQVDMVGGLEAAGPVESHEVSAGKHKGSAILEVVVRNFDLFFNFGFANMDGGETCFSVSDAGAAGKFIHFTGGTSEFQVYPEYLDKDEELQLYELILGGTHSLSDVEIANFPASGPVSFTATFDTVQVSTEGRGQRRNACTGSFGPGDGFEATASFDR